MFDATAWRAGGRTVATKDGFRGEMYRRLWVCAMGCASGPITAGIILAQVDIALVSPRFGRIEGKRVAGPWRERGLTQFV